MWLLEKADTGQIDFSDVNNTLEVIAAWSFRARITNIISTGEIGTILTTKILELLKNKNDDTPYAEYLWFELSNYRLRDIYPTDAQFKEAFITYHFYKNYRKYVQQKLARAVSHDQTEIVLESIEHIMPQSLRSDKWPQISVSDHAEWVNTIGNLTPMNMFDNPAASNGSYEEKKQFLSHSDWQITRVIVEKWQGWDIHSIQERATELSDLAIDLWKAPAVRTREIEVVQPGMLATRFKQLIGWIEERNLPYIKLDIDHSNNSYLRFTTDFMDTLIPPRDTADGGWRSGRAFYYEIHNISSGASRVNMALNSQNLTDVQKKGQEELMTYLAKRPTKDTWNWFNPTGWTLITDESDETLREDLQRVLETEIPQLENALAEHLNQDSLHSTK